MSTRSGSGPGGKGGGPGGRGGPGAAARGGRLGESGRPRGGAPRGGADGGGCVLRDPVPGLGLGLAAAAALVLPALAGCGGEWAVRSDPDGKPEGPGGVVVVGTGLLLEPPEGGRLPVTRPGSEVVLRFSSPLDPASARGAVRVEDGSRGPLPVEVAVRGRELVLRPLAGRSWRPGSTLRVRVAGLPSLGALRSSAGDPLERDAEVPVAVRSTRRTDRTAPLLLSSEPADGAAGVDPAAPLVLRFSEPMDSRALYGRAGSGGTRGYRGDPVLVRSEGRAVPLRAFLDRSRTVLTLLPEGGLPPGAEVTVELGERVRDAAGNPLDDRAGRRISFTTGTAGTGGLLVEAFEDDRLMDPLGTTVRWDHPSEPGVLSSVLDPRTLEAGSGGEERALLLDPRGGTLRVLLPAAEVGDEPRVLKGVHLAAAPGSTAGEILEPRLRVAVPPAAGPGEAAEPPLWQEAAAGSPGVQPRGGAYPLPFLHPVRHDGASDLLLELSWTGTAGPVILRAARTAEQRTCVEGPGPEAIALSLSPVVRIEGIGERAVARSLWLDSGASSPAWLAPVPLPTGPGAAIRLQGAPGAADGGPDLSRATGWTEDPALLEGMRWVRFRVLFGAPATLDRLDLPFAHR